MAARIIFVTGGVVSGIGKGISTASIGLIFKQLGYRVVMKKLDPYLNVDPGTISPAQHGEVFVTEDGMECDMDLGHYERFTGIDATKDSNITSGKIYKTLLENERKGKYLGSTVQTIPHITNLIQEFILRGSENVDVILCEIGGTVGDIEALPFFEAARQIKQKHKEGVAFVHLTYVPYLEPAKELKTKPTQHSVKELMSIGIVPDALICRSAIKLGKENKKKIALFCNVYESAVIEAPNVQNIYSIPLLYVKQNFHLELLRTLKLKDANPDLTELEDIIKKIDTAKGVVRVLIAGKYLTKESYKSLCEALVHASATHSVRVDICFVNTKQYDLDKIEIGLFEGIDAIIIPGGFGPEGVEGKLKFIRYARENNIPTLGICYGFQLMVIEFAKNVLGIQNATSEEFAKTENDVILVGLMENFERNGKIEKRTKTSDMGGSMRLGSYKTILKEGSLAAKCYKSNTIFERHRHRYEVNISLKEEFERKGFIFSGISSDGNLPEVGEILNLDFFIGVQFHPELKSKLFVPHPLFLSLIDASIKRRQHKNIYGSSIL